MFVLKRDKKTKECFQEHKIHHAIEKAYLSVGKDIDEEVFNCVIENIKKNEENSADLLIPVESIQDCIEKCLFSCDVEVAISFHDYRLTHKLIRSEKQGLVKEFTKKLMGENIENQNANLDEFSFGGRIGEASNVFKKDFALNNCMSKQTKRNHLNNESYVHDLDNYASGEHNCLSMPIDKLLANGVKVGQIDIRPAGSINTAMQLTAVYFQIQSQEQFGGVSVTHYDWSMVPYVRKSFFKHYVLNYIKREDDFKTLSIINLTNDEIDEWVDEHKEKFLNKFGLKTEDFTLSNIKNLDESLANVALFDTRLELMQAVEGLYHNLNSLQSRSGNQLPFTSMNYGSCTLPEGQMVIEALLDGSLRGIGKHHLTPIFPCGIFQVGKGVNRNEGDPNYYLFKKALRSTAKRIYPNYANLDWSGNKGYDKNDPKTYFSTMGCRTANSLDINGFGQTKDGRGNICPQTIILPTLAMEALDTNEIETLRNGVISGDKDKKIDKFMRILSRKIDQTVVSLMERFEWIASQNPKSAPFMWINGTMEGYVPEEGIISALKHGTLAVGQLGLAEALQILIGKNHTTDEGMELAKRIERLFRKKCLDYKEEYKLNFGVYYTPAENLCYTAMKKFKDKYGIIPNVSDRAYFTNSIHVPVWEEMTPFQKIDIESQLTGYSSAGCITYVEVDSKVSNNIDALEEVVNYAMDKDIPYFAINFPIDNCKNCGYSGEFEGDKCPICESENIEHLGRVTGYLSSDVRRFNYGKQNEFKERIHHEEHILV